MDQCADCHSDNRVHVRPLHPSDIHWTSRSVSDEVPAVINTSDWDKARCVQTECWGEGESN